MTESRPSKKTAIEEVYIVWEKAIDHESVPDDVDADCYDMRHSCIHGAFDTYEKAVKLCQTLHLMDGQGAFVTVVPFNVPDSARMTYQVRGWWNKEKQPEEDTTRGRRRKISKSR